MKKMLAKKLSDLSVWMINRRMSAHTINRVSAIRRKLYKGEM